MLLNKKTCVCGKDLKNEPFKNYKPNLDIEFYAGNVEMIGEHTCECGRILKGFFKRDEKGELKLIDLEVIGEIAMETNDELDIKSEENKPTSDMPTEEKVENKPTSKGKKK